MAKAFPKSRFFGFDYHDASISSAQLAAEEEGVADRITFAVAGAKRFSKSGKQGYDLVTFFDCLHDMGDPVGAAGHVCKTLAPGGSWMIVEPMAGDSVQENLNPVGRLFYCASTMICTPASLSQEVGLALGAQAGEKQLRAVLRQVEDLPRCGGQRRRRSIWCWKPERDHRAFFDHDQQAAGE